MAASNSAERRKVVGDLNACDTAFTVCWYLAGAFLLLGLVGELANLTLGLESISWFLLVIAALLAGVAFRIGWAVGWYLKTTG